MNSFKVNANMLDINAKEIDANAPILVQLWW